MADILREQAFEEVSEDINTSVGLQIVSEPGFLSLCSPDGQVVTKVPHSTDPMDDIDLIRQVWFASSRLMSNNSWD
tara:strand:+ start:1033 stop:1260 length:228 start_codon:yes stop_codon:yes gene_type:complete